MNDLMDTFYTALVAKTAAGQPLNALLDRLHRDELDFWQASKARAPETPFAFLRPGAAVPVAATHGSRWTIYDADAAIVIVRHVPATPSDEQWNDAREAVETLSAAFDRVLAGLRYSANRWHEMTWTAVGGPSANLGGKNGWGKTITCSFRFRRYRAA